MKARQRGGVEGPRSLVLTIVVTGLLALAPASASAAATVGGNFGTPGCTGGSTPYTGMQVQTASPGNSYAAPFDGVLTSWSASPGFVSAAKLKVVRVGSGGNFTVIGDDGPRPADGSSNPIRIPVRLGDVLGLHYSAQTGCKWGTGYPAAYTTSEATSDVPPGPGTFSGTQVWGGSGARLPVAAQIEADADGDGFGDESQDGCPSLATVQGPCPLPDTQPPQTTIDKAPKKKTKSKKAKFTFSSSEPGSTFECSLDSQGFKPCTSPKKLKVKKLGKHNFLVRARDAAGNLDTTEASYSWKRVARK